MKRVLCLDETSSTNVCTQKTVRRIVFAYLIVVLMIGLVMQSLPELLSGMKAIVMASGVLVSDYYVLAGVGPALVNGALVALIGCFLLVWNDMPFNGLPLAAIFTLFGFALFGKNVISILPILAGSFLFAKSTKQPFKNVVCAALFATCLAPLGPQVAFTMGLGLPLGIFCSMLAGFLVPALAKPFAQFHKGFNLYNIGFTAGITGTLIISGFRLFGHNSVAIMSWGESFDGINRLIFIPVLVSMCVLGWWLRGGYSYKALLAETGVSPSDFVSQHGFGLTLFNMGLMGLLGVLYIELVGSHYNGATVGGIFTMAAFGAFGKHPKNCFPIMLGIYCAALLSPSISPIVPGAMLAALFGTTLAPIAGKYGFLAGLVTGACHLMIVFQVGVLHGGVNLYNNGFSGGLTAIIIVSLIQVFEKSKIIENK